MDAPREVWITVRDGKISASSVAGRAPFFGTKFVRADVVAEILGSSEQTTKEIAIAARELVAPSAQPSESTARERRLAEAVVYLLGDIDEVPEEKREDEIEAIAAEARAVLASPEAPAKAWIEVAKLAPFRWSTYIQGPTIGRTYLVDGNTEDIANRVADLWAAASGLEVRR